MRPCADLPPFEEKHRGLPSSKVLSFLARAYSQDTFPFLLVYLLHDLLTSCSRSFIPLPPQNLSWPRGFEDILPFSRTFTPPPTETRVFFFPPFKLTLPLRLPAFLPSPDLNLHPQRPMITFFCILTLPQPFYQRDSGSGGSFSLDTLFTLERFPLPSKDGTLTVIREAFIFRC